MKKMKIWLNVMLAMMILLSLSAGAVAEEMIENNAEVSVAAPILAPEEAPKAETPKAETPKAETPKAETPKAEAPKAETPKAEASKAEAPKAEAPKAEAPKAEAPEAEAPEATKAEAPKSEAEATLVKESAEEEIAVEAIVMEKTIVEEMMPEEIADADMLSADMQELDGLLAREPMQEEPFGGSVTIRIDGKAGGFVYGDTVTMEAVLNGYEGVDYLITWEYSENGIDWVTASGKNHTTTYRFQLNEENAFWAFRAAVMVL